MTLKYVKRLIPGLLKYNKTNIIKKFVFPKWAKDSNINSISADANDLLIQTHIKKANMLFIAIPDNFKARDIIKAARALNSKIKILVRCHNHDEMELMKKETSCDTFLGEEELAKSMTKRTGALSSFRARPRITTGSWSSLPS